MERLPSAPLRREGLGASSHPLGLALQRQPPAGTTASSASDQTPSPIQASNQVVGEIEEEEVSEDEWLAIQATLQTTTPTANLPAGIEEEEVSEDEWQAIQQTNVWAASSSASAATAPTSLSALPGSTSPSAASSAYSSPFSPASRATVAAAAPGSSSPCSPSTRHVAVTSPSPFSSPRSTAAPATDDSGEELPFLPNEVLLHILECLAADSPLNLRPMLSVCLTWRNWVLTEPSFWGDSSACVRLPPWSLEQKVDTSSSLLMTRGVVVWRERLWGTGTVSNGNSFSRISHRACLWQWRSARRELAHDASGSVSEASTYCCLHVWKNLLVSGESSGYVTLWSAAPSSRYSVSKLGRFAIFTLCGQSTAKENLMSLTTWRVGSEELLCCGGSKGSVHIFRTPSASVGLEYCFSLPQGSHRQAVYCMVQRGPYLITAGADPWLKVWEHRSFTNTCHCLATMNTNQAVYAMTVWNGHVCAGGSGAKVQVWNENWTLTTSLKHRKCIISLATFKGQLA
ncbi:hypothetical protein QOT17_024200, partial [Balamuthia mandrillaris]